MPTFWDTLLASGAQAASKVLTPLGGGISGALSNLVQTGQNKVTAVSNTIVATTNPNKPAASQPATPPTTTVKPASSAQTQATLGIFMVIAVIVLVLFLKRKN